MMVSVKWEGNVVFRMIVFFFQAEDGIRDAQESRGLGDVYKRQVIYCLTSFLFIGVSS